MKRGYWKYWLFVPLGYFLWSLPTMIVLELILAWVGYYSQEVIKLGTMIAGFMGIIWGFVQMGEARHRSDISSHRKPSSRP